MPAYNGDMSGGQPPSFLRGGMGGYNPWGAMGGGGYWDARRRLNRENWQGNPYTQSQARLAAEQEQERMRQMQQMMQARAMGAGNVGGRSNQGTATQMMLNAMFGGGGGGFGGGLPGF